MKNQGWSKKWEYAIYKGDECLSVGTKDEICEELGIKPQTFAYYRSISYKKRVANRTRRNGVGYRTIIRIDNDSDDDI